MHFIFIQKERGNIYMDMIAEILKRKQKVDYDIPTTVYNIVKEIVQYDKLSKTEKFKDLNHPLVARKCPTLVKAQDASTIEFYLLSELLPVFIQLTGRNIGMLELYEMTKQERILNKSYDIHIFVQEITSLFTRPDEFVAVEEIVDGIKKLMVVTVSDKTVMIYEGSVEFGDTIVDTVCKPIAVVLGDDRLTLNSYSTLGNNDYHFGYINNKPIRIRDGQLLVDSNAVPLNMAELAIQSNIKDIALNILHQYQKGATNGIS